MNEEEKVTFISKGKNGDETEFEILFDFEEPETGNTYAVYTDNIPDENGEVDIYVCRWEVEDGKTILEQIDDEEEFQRVRNLMAQRISGEDEI